MTRPVAKKSDWLTLPHGTINWQILQRRASHTYSSGVEVCEAQRIGDTWRLPRELFSLEDLEALNFDVEVDAIDFERIREQTQAFYGTRKVDPSTAPTELMRTIQTDALSALGSAGGGIIQVRPGRGKTVIGLAYAQQMGVPVVAHVHTKELMTQWVERATSHLGLDPDRIGVIGDGKCDYEGKSLVVAMVQTLMNKPELMEELSKSFFGAIYDEVHHYQAERFRLVLPWCKGYRLGLSATVAVGGLEQVFFDHLGKVVYFNDAFDLIPQIVVHDVKTDLSPGAWKRINANVWVDVDKEITVWQNRGLSPHASRQKAVAVCDQRVKNARMSRTMSELAVYDDFSEYIASQVVAHREQGRVQLVLSDRKDQLEGVRAALDARGVTDYLVATGDSSRAENERAKQEGEGSIVLATCTKWLEGLDRKDICTLHVGLPWTSKKRLVQGTGRILRDHVGKQQPLVHIYRPLGIALLYGMWNSFLTNCRREKFPITHYEGGRAHAQGRPGSTNRAG